MLSSVSFDANEPLSTTKGRETHYEFKGETGYLYNLNQMNKKTCVYKCHYRSGCKATILTDHEGRVVKHDVEGLHLPECIVTPYDYINRQAKQQLIRHAKNLSTTLDAKTLKGLYEDMRMSLMDSDKTSVEYVTKQKYKEFVKYNSVKSTLGKNVAGSREIVANPHHVSELLGQLNDPTNEKLMHFEVNPGNDERFVLSGVMHDDDVCIILGSESMFAELISQEVICVDGTFKVVPDILYDRRNK
jgi:hypothetical protein